MALSERGLFTTPNNLFLCRNIMLAKHLNWPLRILLFVRQELLQIIVVDFHAFVLGLNFSNINHFLTSSLVSDRSVVSTSVAKVNIWPVEARLVFQSFLSTLLLLRSATLIIKLLLQDACLVTLWWQWTQNAVVSSFINTDVVEFICCLMDFAVKNNFLIFVVTGVSNSLANCPATAFVLFYGIIIVKNPSAINCFWIIDCLVSAG